jgi:hypothetical protein
MESLPPTGSPQRWSIRPEARRSSPSTNSHHLSDSLALPDSSRAPRSILREQLNCSVCSCFHSWPWKGCYHFGPSPIVFPYLYDHKPRAHLQPTHHLSLKCLRPHLTSHTSHASVHLLRVHSSLHTTCSTRRSHTKSKGRAKERRVCVGVCACAMMNECPFPPPLPIATGPVSI